MSIFKKKLAAFSTVLAFMALSGASFAYLDGQATVNNASSNTNIYENGSTLNVDNISGEHGSVSQVDWGKLGNSTGEEIHFGFSGFSQTIINRVLGGSKSSFFGKLTSGCAGGGTCSSFGETGKVVIINPAGILFGAGSQVDINSLTASTRDFTGSRNLTGVKATDDAYVDGLRNATVSGIKYNRYLTFENSKGNGTTKIEINGSTFDDFDSLTGKNTNKSVNFVADNISYKNSQISTGDNFNYNGNSSFAKVNLITADGVDFVYLINGYTDSETVRENASSTVAKTIDIDNAGSLALDPTTQSIRSGNVNIVNKGKAEGSDIKIANSIIKGTKLIADEVGNIYIKGERNVNVTHSRLEANNTHETVGGVDINTVAQDGGEVFIGAGKNVTVSDSLIYSAPTTNSDASAGNVRIFAYDGKATVNDGTRIFAKADAEIMASGDVEIADSWVQASNTSDLNRKLDVVVRAGNAIDIKNSALHAPNGNVVIKGLDNESNPANIINILETKDGKGSDSIIFASDNIYIWGKDTTIDDTALAYQNLSFYSPDSDQLNNVTIKNDTTFSKLTAAGGFDPKAEITVETNGNLTFDNATVRRAGIKIDTVRNASGEIVDDNTVDGIKTVKKITRNENYIGSDINLTSTKGNVTIRNKSDIKTNATLDVSANGNIIVDDSILSSKDYGTSSGPVSLTAKGDVTLQNNANVASAGNTNIKSTAGSVNIKNNSKATSTNLNVNITAHNDITFGAQGATGVNIDKTSTIAANEGSVTIKSENGDINLEKTTSPVITYGERLTFNAKGNNNITSDDSLKSVNVDYIAGNSNNFTTADDIQFVNSTLNAKTNNIKTTNGGDVILNKLTIISATDNPADTKTNIIATGDVTTKDVTGSYVDDMIAGVHSYPQSVQYGTSTETNTVLDVNQTKLVVKTNATPKAGDRADKGSVNLLLTNADNKNAGIEITAENVGGWDVEAKNDTKYNGYDENGISYGPVVTIDSATVNGSKDSIAISKIVTDKLNIVKGNDLIAASVDKAEIAGYGSREFTQTGNSSINPTNPKGYIEVRDRGGLNLDANPVADSTPDGFIYTDHFGSETDPITRVISSDEHYIHFDDNGTTPNPDHDFMLVYNKDIGTAMPECPDYLPEVDDKTHQTIDDKESMYEDDLGIVRPTTRTFSAQQAEQQAADIMQAAVNTNQKSVDTEKNSKNDKNDKDELLK